VKHLKDASLRVGPGLTCKQKTKLERLARDKRSSSLQKVITYDRKKAYTFGPRCRIHNTSFSSLLTNEANKLVCW
jgi:hypothetical protein